MGFGAKPGITKISELEIDADKDWAAMGISNIKELALAMAWGDINYRGSDVMEKLTAGLGGQVLHTMGPLHPPYWAWLKGTLLQEIYFFLVLTAPSIQMAIAANVVGAVTATPSLALTAPSESEALATQSPTAIDGALADDGGVQTDETTEANSAAANDMTLLPTSPEVDDAYYFGLSTPWDWLCLNIGQAGLGTWTIVWEYYNGATWEALPDALDTSDGFHNSGKHSVTFSRPEDWATSTILLLNLYWARARVTAVA